MSKPAGPTKICKAVEYRALSCATLTQNSKHEALIAISLIRSNAKNGAFHAYVGFYKRFGVDLWMRVTYKNLPIELQPESNQILLGKYSWVNRIETSNENPIEQIMYDFSSGVKSEGFRVSCITILNDNSSTGPKIRQIKCKRSVLKNYYLVWLYKIEW